MLFVEHHPVQVAEPVLELNHTSLEDVLIMQPGGSAAQEPEVGAEYPLELANAVHSAEVRCAPVEQDTEPEAYEAIT